MSVTESPSRPRASDATAAAPRPSWGAWARVLLVCAVLAASGAVRAWQVRRIERDLRKGREAPITLADVPMKVGDWNGTSTEIDPQIARAAGADQVVTRRYVNEATGTSIDVILLFGPAHEVYLHSPEKCYPAAGFLQAAGPDEKSIPLGEGRSAPFRSLVYTKGEGATAEPVEVYYTWWYNGRWTPSVGKQKHFERIPGMYKVHVARRVTGGERRDVANPNEIFLRELMPDLERRLAARASAPAPAPAS